MKSKFVKKTLTLVLCIAMLSSNLAFAEGSVSGDAIEQHEVDEIGLLKEDNNTEDDEEKTDKDALHDDSAGVNNPSSESGNKSEEKTAENDDGLKSDDSSVSENSVSENSISGNSVSENSVSGNSITFLYYDNEKTVDVKVPDDAFAGYEKLPNLNVIEIVNEDELTEVKEDVEKEIDEDQFINAIKAYDIHFDIDGKEVEPNGDAQVNIVFNETIKPAGIDEMSTASVLHIDEKEGEKSVSVVADDIQNSDGEVKKINFETSSFSTFTIIWTYAPNLIINCIDINGDSIFSYDYKTNLTEANFNNDVSVKDISKIIKQKYNNLDYLFDRAVVCSNNNPKISPNIISSISYKKIYSRSSKEWCYKKEGNTTLFKLNSGENFYFIYKEAPKLSLMETISTSDKINLSLFDYNQSKINNGKELKFIDGSKGEGRNEDNEINNYTGHTGGGVRQEIVKKTLNEEGFPELTNGGSLNYLFNNDSSNKVIYSGLDKLFSQARFEEDRTYSYSSFENFAQLDLTNNNFKVYDQIATPVEKSNEYNPTYFPYFYRGNYFPLNKLKDGYFSELTRLYDNYENELEQNDDGYNEPLFLTLNDENKNIPNNHFGMKLATSFTQSPGGDYNGKNMIFSFNGDDDLWIFIDNVLVLDLGGIHSCYSGSINFNTGVVKINDGHHEDDDDSISIRQCFSDAGVINFSNFSTVNAKTFKDNTSHTLEMFYLERGAGASNLEMNFNLPLIERKTIEIEKEVEGLNASIQDEKDYEFELYTKNASNQEPVKFIGNYTVTGEEETRIATGGIIRVKSGQKAAIPNIEIGSQYYVKEINIDDKVNAVKINENDKTINENAVESDPYTVGDTNKVKFTNTLNVEDLYIKKIVDKDINNSDIFDIRLYLDNGKGSYEAYTGDYKVESSIIKADGGTMQIKKDQEICVKDIPVGTKFKITEVSANGSPIAQKYYEPKYTETQNFSSTFNKDGSNWGKTTDEIIVAEPKAAEGTIIKDKDAHVTITNKPLLGEIIVEKIIDRADIVNGDPIFTFKLTNKDQGIYYYKTVRFIKDKTNQSKSVVFDNLPLGNYTLEELDTIRYQCDQQNLVDVTISASDLCPKRSFNNEKVNNKNFSHTDLLINEFTLNENGKVSSITQKTNKEGDTE